MMMMMMVMVVNIEKQVESQLTCSQSQVKLLYSLDLDLRITRNLHACEAVHFFHSSLPTALKHTSARAVSIGPVSLQTMSLLFDQLR